MRLVIQRVESTSVSVGSNVVGKIEKGLLVLVGVGQEDNEEKVEEQIEKVSKLRIMADKNKKMNKSVVDVEAKILAVSQFTLYADTSKGNRPSFIKAAKPEKAKTLYDHFVKGMRDKGVAVETGSFGEYMNISAKLDGPVTIVLDN